MATTDGIPNAILAATPAGKPPPGVQSDFYGHPATTGTPFIIIGAILVVIMLGFVALRNYVKFKITHNAWWDDLTCNISAFCVVFYYINGVLCTVVGHFGRHQWNLSVLMQTSGWLSWTIWIENWLSTLTLCIVKCTFFLLYLQIFSPVKWLRLGIYVGMAFTIVAYAGFMIAQLVLLTPRRGENWFEQYQDPREYEVNKASIPLSSISLGIDIYIFIFPMAGIAQLQLSNRKKLGAMAIFLAGFCACIASLLSIYYKVVLNRNTNDSSWYAMIVITTTLIEMATGVSCSCMPFAAKWARYLHNESSIGQSFFSRSFMSMLTGRTTSKTSQASTKSREAGFKPPIFGSSTTPRFGISKPDSTRGFTEVRDSSEASQDDFSLHATEGQQDLELGVVKTMRTFIQGSGDNQNARGSHDEGRGIRLQKEVHQSWRSKK